MSIVEDAFFRSWPFDPGLILALGLTFAIYFRGWLILRRRNPERWRKSQVFALIGGMTAIFLALASPVEPFSFLFLQVHMVQHLLLMMVAPPLVWLGEPLFPLLRGMPQPIRKYWIAPCFRAPAVRSIAHFLTHPVTAWLVYVGATWIWHLPALYELAVRSNGWHYLQHVTIIVVGFLFWYPVVRPYPSRPRWSEWLLLPYLFLADLQNTVLAALLTFSDRALYPYYLEVPRLGDLSAVDDQATAGVFMWVPGSLAFLVPMFWIATRLLFGTGTEKPIQKLQRHRLPSEVWVNTGAATSARVPLPLVSISSMARPKAELPGDLLNLPAIGRLLRWRHLRICLRITVLLFAIAIIYDGWTGPPVAGMNLAGVLPWIHWRGLLILGLLIAGNVFCLACPFMVPRLVARRLFPPRFQWPRWLRNKWLAVVLLVVFLWAYEAFALWDSPWLTAWIAACYFVVALAVDSFFQGAAFCKYVCPIGQFNFVQSLISPLEVKARDAAVCASCQTKDCIRGNASVPGCELHLFVPRKSSNMDCTFCLDCLHACPHDNVGIIVSTPGAELWHDPPRSGLGRFGKRGDLAALVVVLTFGAFANAAGMVGPVTDWQTWLESQGGRQLLFWMTTACYALALIVLPLCLVGSAAWLSRSWAGLPLNWREVATRSVYALVPLGFAMWLSHYSFHFLAGYDAVIPAAQRFAAGFGANFGTPDWTCACCRPVQDWLPRLEILVLDVGFLLSLYSTYRIALSMTADLSHVVRALLPWAVLLLLLFALGVWIVLQPMQMRGMM
jgi:cytochrome c oxidase assembly factor CtaG